MDTPFLTTYNNPYNPYTDFDQWILFDSLRGYNCCGIVARLAPSSPKLSDTENDRFLDAALDNFVKHDFLGLYVKVTPSTAPEIAKRASQNDYMSLTNRESSPDSAKD